MTTVALVGPDGSGKTTVARELAHALPVPVRYLYMGVSAESSNVLLPTTRLARRLKRAVGAAPDTAGPPSHEVVAARTRSRPRSPLRRGARAIRSALRLGNRAAEEWYRQLVAWRWQRGGAVVVYDRHFFLDYHAYDVAGDHDRTLEQRLHGRLVARLPRPDLVVYLDAPAEVLLARKGEGSVEALEQRRAEYRAIAPLVPRFAEVDATRPLDEVVTDVAARILAVVESGRRGDGGAKPPGGRP
jgi:thymidylate kinase